MLALSNISFRFFRNISEARKQFAETSFTQEIPRIDRQSLWPSKIGSPVEKGTLMNLVYVLSAKHQ